jgi:hypothetical protein
MFFNIKVGFKSLPLHFFPLFPGETCQETKKRFELLNTGELIVKSLERKILNR